MGVLTCILALGITFLALWILTNIFGNANAIPGMIFIGALLVPISGLIFFFESNAFKNISIFDVMRMFFIGGVLSLISTMILYQFVTFSTESQYYGIMTITDAFIVGFVEELGKATVVILFINYLKQIKYSMDYLSVLLLVQGSRCLNQLVISLGLDLIYLMELIILLKSLYKEVGQL